MGVHDVTDTRILESFHRNYSEIQECIVLSSKFWTRLVIVFVAGNLAFSSVSADELSLGDARAPVTLVEYGSFTCSKCIHFHKHVYHQIRKHYIDKGVVRFIYRHFPTSGAAVEAARAADCAGEKYYKMVDALFASVADWYQAEKREDVFVEQAASLGLNSEKFLACIGDEKQLDRILREQLSSKKDLDIIGTPTFFINGKIVRGKRSFAEMETLISEALYKDN